MCLVPLSLFSISHFFFFNPPFWIKGCFLVFEITKGNFPTLLCILKDHISFHYFLHIFKAMPVISPQHTQILYRQTHTHLFNVSSWILLCCGYHLGLIISWHFLYWQKLMPKKADHFRGVLLALNPASAELLNQETGQSQQSDAT